MSLKEFNGQQSARTEWSSKSNIISIRKNLNFVQSNQFKDIFSDSIALSNFLLTETREEILDMQ